MNPGGMRLDERGFIDADIPCRKCGYDLRGASPEGRCSECGTAVGLSIQGDLLRFAEPEWVDSLARGTKNILRGWTILMTGIVGAIAVGAIAGSMAAGPPPWLVSLIEYSSLVLLLGSAIEIWGAWQLTRPDPGGVNDEQYSSSRRMIRVLLMCSLAAFVRQPLESALPASLAVHVIAISIMIGSMLAGMAGYFVKFQYFEQLARRIPDAELATRAKSIRRWFAATTILLIATYGFLFVARLGPGGLLAMGWAMPIGCFGSILSLVMLGLVLKAVRLVKKIGMSLSEQAKVARETWARAAAAPSPASHSISRGSVTL